MVDPGCQSGVQFMVADMATALDAAQLLIWAAWLKDTDCLIMLRLPGKFATDTAMEVCTMRTAHG